jgi:hypothetical protein
MSDSRLKIISDVEADANVVSVKKPFKLVHEMKRRYIRLEISEPVTFSVLRDNQDGFWPQGNGPSFSGRILNVSAGGVLIVTEEPVMEGTLILLKMSLQDIEVLDHIIGLVKRVDDSGGEWLIGIEFVTREYLNDVLSRGEIDVLTDAIASFDERLQETLNKYVYYKRVSEAGK